MGIARWEIRVRSRCEVQAASDDLVMSFQVANRSAIDIRDLELPARRPRRRAPAHGTQARHGKAVFRRTGPASSKPQLMSELRNHPRKLTPNSATFTRTGHPLSRPVEDCAVSRACRGSQSHVWTIPVQVVQIHIAISVAWEAGRLARCNRVD